MAHRHAVSGVITSEEVIDPSNPDMHWHTIGGDSSSSDLFGHDHRHTWRGILTSTPIGIIDGGEDE